MNQIANAIIISCEGVDNEVGMTKNSSGKWACFIRTIIQRTELCFMPAVRECGFVTFDTAPYSPNVTPISLSKCKRKTLD